MRYFGMLAISASALIATPVSAAPKTAQQTVGENGVYFWVDGLYEHVKLPTYGLGLHNTSSTPYVDVGPLQTFNPRLNGGGVRAAIGYGIPGTTTRIEFGGSYIDASASQSSSISPTGLGAGLLLTGAGVASGFNCQSPVFACATTGVLGTDYRAWSFNGKAETDWKYGSVTVMPSLAVFGGNTRADQTLTQALTQFLGGAAINSGSYSARTELEWRDLGARVGLHLSSAVTPSFIIGWGGSVSVAARSVSLSGSDVSNSTNPAGFIVGSSALVLDDNRTVLLANAEANFIWHLTSVMSLTGFAGLHYDGDVPGIAAPSYAGSVILGVSSRSAASIVYDSQTSLYAGGGLVVKFGGTR